ncbi:MAG: TolC family protein [Acidobacteriota bacterium]|jgi:outer membrane protein TolC|nr:TolC family protein [Acidobacteriota bacterium]
MRYIMLVLGMTATLAAEERGPLSLSLKRAVEIATSQEGSTPIQLSAESLKQAELRSKEARAALLPDVEGAFSYENRTANLAAMGISLTRLPFPGFEFPTFVGPFLTMDARASVTQSVFDVSSIRKFQASKVGVSAARSDSESASEQVAAVVARAYLGAVRADTDVETAQANVMLSQAVLRQAENQKNAGTGTGIEITRARVQLANDQQRLLVTENARRAAHLQLLRAMGVRLDTEVQLTDGLQYVAVDALTLENARAQALRDRPDYKAQQEREANARLMASATVMERLPSLAAFGDYGSSGSAFSNSLPTRTYGISLKVPLWDGARRDARRAESASQHRAEAIRTNDVREQIELDVRLALDALSSAQDQVKVAKDGLDLAESELEQARRRYQAGISDSLEVTDAQTRLERARDNQTAALYNYNVARIDLAQAMGVVRRTIQ